MAFLLDTCAISELVAKVQNPRAIHAITNLPRAELFISVITAGELHAGIHALPASARKTFLTSWLNDYVLSGRGPRLLAFDLPVAMQWGELKSDTRRRGLTMQTSDSLIAATALAHDLTLVTRNDKDFAHTSLRLFNPWR